MASKRTVDAIRCRANTLGLHCQSQAIYGLDSSKNILYSYEKITDVSKDGFSRTAVNLCLKGHIKSSGGVFWCYQKDYPNFDIPSFKMRDLSHTEIYDLDNHIIYSSPEECSQKTGLSKAKIIRVCDGLENAVHNRHFCFLSKKDQFQIKQNQDEQPCVCLNTKKHYKTCTEAALDIGLKSTRANSVGSVCRHKSKTIKGLTFVYEKDYSDDLLPNPPFIKKVKCVETQKIFDSARVASEYYHITRSSISRCCNKAPHYKTAGGYHWEFVEVESNKNHRFN